MPLEERLRLATTSGTIKRLHVDKQRVRGSGPAITVQTSKGPIKAREVEWDGRSWFVDGRHKPLQCGARLWIETKSKLRVFGAELP